MLEKAKKVCTSCETKYTVTWDSEEGDLGFHVKRMRSKNEHFSEDFILNLF